MTTCYIALGSNLSQPELQLKQAVKQLKNHSDWQLLKVSSFYQSSALTLPGSVKQNDYINAVALLDTQLDAEQLLLKLQAIELSQGRERKHKWAARTLDLDILLYADQCIQTKHLTIPHSQMKFRNFVLYPLFEIAGDIIIPGLGALSMLLDDTHRDGLVKLTDSSVG